MFIGRKGRYKGTSVDRRKEMILIAVVEEYIRSAQPVGSRTVVKSGIKASSATVRSEMSVLEEMGLLEHPHTSSGRVPTDLGFRCYVDYLLDQKLFFPDDRKCLQSLQSLQQMTTEDLVGETARVLSKLSNIVGMVMVVPAERAPLRSVHFFDQGRENIRVVFDLAGGQKEERVITNDFGLDPVVLQRLSSRVNRFIPGHTLIGLRRELLRQLEEARAQADVLLARAAEISATLVAVEQPDFFICGQANLFDLPEFSEVHRIKEVVRTLEEKTMLVRMLEGINLSSGIRVVIGRENAVESMHCCSVVARSYGRDRMTAGTLGVIGPTRMDYARLIPLVHYTSELISECLQRRD